MKSIRLYFILVYLISIFSACGVSKDISEIDITMPDLNLSSKGKYLGSFSTRMVSAEVAIELSDSKIRDIELISHETGFGKKAETLIDSVLIYQTVELDVITGATVSSKVILKAIENAIEKSNIN